MNATIGADGVRVASMPSTIAVVPHEQNGVSVREHDRGADGCPAPLRQPAAEPVGSQVHRNRGRRPARASRRRPSDRRPQALRGARGELSAHSCAGVASPGRADPAWSPGTPVSRSPRTHVRGERSRRWLRGQSMRQAHVTGVKRCRLDRVPASNRGTRCPQNPSKQRHIHTSGEGIRAAAMAGERRRHAARAPRLGRGGWARSGRRPRRRAARSSPPAPSGSTERYR
jgi:hypothetical protein